MPWKSQKMCDCHKIVVCKWVTTYLAEVGNFFPPVGDGQEVRGSKICEDCSRPFEKIQKQFSMGCKNFWERAPIYYTHL